MKYVGRDIDDLNRGFPFEMPKYTDCFDSANGPSILVERGELDKVLLLLDLYPAGDSKKQKKIGQFYRGKYKTKSLVDLGRADPKISVTQR